MKKAESGSGSGSLGCRIPESCDRRSQSETSIIVQNLVEAIVILLLKQHRY